MFRSSFISTQLRAYSAGLSFALKSQGLSAQGTGLQRTVANEQPNSAPIDRMRD
jgi:hypothetical protein